MPTKFYWQTEEAVTFWPRATSSGRARNGSSVTIDVTKRAVQERLIAPPVRVVDPTPSGQPPNEPDPGDELPAELHAAATQAVPNRTKWVPVLIIGMLATAALIFTLVPGGPPDPTRWQFEWWMLALGFVVTESTVIHIRVQRDSHTISMSEVPFVLGLALASPLALLLGRLAAGIAVLVGRRQSPLKLTFNMVIFVLETSLATAVYRSVIGPYAPASPRGWLAAMAAIGVAVSASAALVEVAIALSDRRRRPAEMFSSFATGTLISIGIGFMGTVGVVVLHYDARAAILLGGAMCLFFILFRTYGALNSRHDDLSSLYRFTNQIDGTLSDSPDR